MAREPLVSTEFGSYPPDTLLDQEALAACLRVSARTLRRMVARLELPPGLRLGGKKVWIVATIRKFLEERAAELASKSVHAAAGVRKASGASLRRPA
jgi:predicted DNA-binding transcriptional regulator AlpA